MNAEALALELPELEPVAQPARDALVQATVYSDPLCRWAYSYEPVLRTVEARYGGQIGWTTVLIGLVETLAETVARGSTAEQRAQTTRRFRRYGMPVRPLVRPRPIASAPACQLVHAARIQGDHFAWALLRLLRFAWFTTDLLLDEHDALRAVASRVVGLDIERALIDMETAAVEEAYRRDRSLARSPSQVAVELRRTARSDGPERYTAPTVVLTGAHGSSAVVPGFQPFEALDVALMNLEPRLVRAAPPGDVEDALRTAAGGLITQEIARVVADTTSPPDRDRAEEELVRADCRRPRAPVRTRRRRALATRRLKPSPTRRRKPCRDRHRTRLPLLHRTVPNQHPNERRTRGPHFTCSA